MPIMIFAICILVFAILGVFINIIAYVFISRKKNRSMFHDLLKILTIYDFNVVICCALQFALPDIWPAYAKKVHPYVMVILLPSIHIVVMSSVYSTILISFERFIRICYYCQLKETNVITEENIKYYKIAVVIFPILFYVPKLFEISVEPSYTENTKLVNCHNYVKLSKYLDNPKTRSIIHHQFNSTELEHITKLINLCELDINESTNSSSAYRNITMSRTKVLSIVPTSLRKNVYYHQIYFVYLNTIFASVLPLCLLLFFNIRTAHELFFMSRNDKRNKRRRISYQFSVSNRESLASDFNVPPRRDSDENHQMDHRHIIEEKESSDAGQEPSTFFSQSSEPQEINEERRKSRVSFGGFKNQLARQSFKSGTGEEYASEGGIEGAKGRRARKFQSAISLVSSVRNSFSEKVSHINKEKRLARISLCIVWLFIFCHACKLIPTGYEVWMSSSGGGSSQDIKFPQWIITIENVSHTLITLNSALNFIIYIIL